MKIFLYLVPILLFGCSKSVSQDRSYTYLALGDSYTIGESVSQQESFPFQLSASLTKQDLRISKPKIIARTGWTTGDLSDAIREENMKEKFDIVTLLIGVNNQYRGYSEEDYRKEFMQLLNTAIGFANGKKDRVFVISIPDWGVTPFATGQDRNMISKKIDAFNSINKTETLKAEIKYTDITPASRMASTDRTLIAVDGLHPSAKMYTNWVNALAPKIITSLKKD